MRLFKHRVVQPWNDYFDGSRWSAKMGVHKGVYLCYEQELLSKGGTEWRTKGGYLYVSLTTHFDVGPQHIYYDGPHCSFSLGFLHFAWNLWHCNKCESET